MIMKLTVNVKLRASFILFWPFHFTEQNYKKQGATPGGRPTGVS
jgi:hypothetical protein